MAILKWGSEQVVNTGLAPQPFPVVASLAGGGYVIAWLNGLSSSELHFQRYDAAGRRVGSETKLPQSTGAQDPSIIALANGNFTIGFSDDTAAHAVTYDPDGVVIASLDSTGTNPIVAPLGAGLALVTESAHGEIILAGGNPPLITLEPGVAEDPSAAASPDLSRLAVTFRSGGGLVLQLSETDGNPYLRLLVTTAATGGISDSESTIAWLDNYHVVVTWLQWNDSSFYDVFAAVMYVGDPVRGTTPGQTTGPFRVNTFTIGNQHNHAVTALPTGGFAIAWEDDSGFGLDDDRAIRLAVFDQAGRKLGSDIVVNTSTSRTQRDPSLAALPDGRIVVSWTDSSSATVRSQIIDPRDGLVVGTSAGETLYGNDQINDEISAGAGNDRLLGLRGNDALHGGEGNDLLVGGLGDDSLYGGNGIDTADYAGAASGVVVNLAIGQASGGDGYDLLESVENVIGSAFDDTITGDGLANSLTGGLGNDRLSGGDGIDTADYSGAPSGVVVNLTTGKAAGGHGSDLLDTVENVIGSAFDDTLTGNGFINSLTGRDGNDSLNGAGGEDTLDGGNGNDRYYVDTLNDRVLEATGGGIDTVYANTSWAMTAGQEIENLHAYGVGATSGVALTGNSLDNKIHGGSGVDTLGGGAGNDRYYVDNFDDQVLEQLSAGIDTVYASTSWAMTAGQEIENLRAYGEGAISGVMLTGNELDNIIYGGSGVDTLGGGAGNDRYYVDNLGDQVHEAAGGGSDTVRASTSWTMTAGEEIERLRAFGPAAAAGVTLTGNALANRLYGADGSDVLNGGLGNDALIGGVGNDIFLFDSLLGSGNIDKIADLAAGDTIALDDAVFTALAPGALDVAAFALDHATGTSAQIIYNQITGALYYDSNGALSGGSTRFAGVTGAPPLDHTYFTVV